MRFVALDDLDLSRTVMYRGQPHYPERVAALLGDQAPATIWLAGDSAALERVDAGRCLSVGVMASIDSPPEIKDLMLPVVRQLFGSDLTVIGGFHSPLERACLSLLLKENCQVLVCLARTLVKARVPAVWQRPLLDGRMVIVSPFPETRTRATVESAAIRNECVAALADSLLILYASPGSKTEEFSRILITGNRRPVWTLANPANQILLNLGARPAGEGLPFVQRHSVGK